ncbi:MAG: TetR/AcrR family transcriptional regulator [Clostridia bacterium]|nr:TetR/AcrR family transcriptional regulator [Clostridia bacterium]
MRRSQQTEQTRQKIIATVFRLFETDDYSKITIRRIAQECEMGLGTFYKYFSSKDEILLELTKRINEELKERFNEEMPQDMTASERYAHFVKIHIAVQRRFSPIESAYLIAMLSEHMSPVPELYTFDVTQILCSIIGDGIRSGEFRSDTSLEMFLQQYFIIFFGAGFMRRTVGKDNIEQLYASGEQALLLLIRTIENK